LGRGRDAGRNPPADRRRPRQLARGRVPRPEGARDREEAGL